MARQTIKKQTYSMAFKLRVIEEIEAGMSISEARNRFNVGGKMTIGKWVRSFGNQNLLPISKGAKMPVEKNSELEVLKREKTKLEADLLEMTIQKICMESLVEATEEHYGIDLKKNFGDQAQKKLKQKQKNKK